MEEKTQVVWHRATVTREQREQLNGHQGCVVWLTGLSGCGKSTIANLVDQKLLELGLHSYILDGDNIRHQLNASPERLAPVYGEEFGRRFGLGFSEIDRRENIRRIAAVAQLFAAAGMVTLVAFVSPYRQDRDAARALVDSGGRPGDFVEVFVDAPLEVCEARDPKGLYRQARAGALRNFTGIDAPYEAPERPELVLDSASLPPVELAEQVIDFLRRSQKLPTAR